MHKDTKECISERGYNERGYKTYGDNYITR